MPREEVAELAGFSIDCFVRLKQGSGLRPSADVVEALSRALRLAPMNASTSSTLPSSPQDSSAIAFRAETPVNGANTRSRGAGDLGGPWPATSADASTWAWAVPRGLRDHIHVR